MSFNILENKHVIKNLKTDITVTSEVLIDKPKKHIFPPHPVTLCSIFAQSYAYNYIMQINKNWLSFYSDEGYLPFRFVPSFFAPVGGSDTALINHVIAKERGIEDTTQCLIVCMMNRCRSLNYDKTEKICEVNDVTKDDYPRDLSAKAGFQHYHPMKQPVVVKKYN